VIIFGFYQYKYDEAKDKTDRFKQEIEIFDKELASLQARQDKIKDSLKMVNAVNVLFETRIDWLSFLKEIEKRTLKSVYYTELKAQGIDNVFLRGRAKTTEDGLVQMKVFRTASEFMQDVAVKNFAVREEEVTVQKTGEGTEGEKTEEIQKKSFVEFEVEFKVNPEWLKLRN
jgi:flagellar biosynthesis regulator FlaF